MTFMVLTETETELFDERTSILQFHGDIPKEAIEEYFEKSA